MLGAPSLSDDGLGPSASITAAGREPQTVSISWSVVSAVDGHETVGLLIFTAGTARPPEVPTDLTQTRPHWFAAAVRLVAVLALSALALPVVSRPFGLASPLSRVAGAAGGLLGAVALMLAALERGDPSDQPTRPLLAVETYRSHCLTCRGPDSAGIATGSDPLHAHDGSLSIVKPDTRRLGDGDLHWRITWGIPDAGMPAHDVAFTEQERWNLVAYLRLLPERDSPRVPPSPENEGA